MSSGAAGSFTADNCFFASFHSGSLTVNKANLTVKADAKGKTYDGAVYSPFTATLSGFVNNETDASLRNAGARSGSAGCKGEATEANNASSTTCTTTPTAGNLTSNNYDLTGLRNETLT